MKITIFYKIMALIMSVFASLSIGTLPPPATDDPITAEDGAAMTFVLWGDPQISNYMYSRARYTERACEDIINSGLEFDALVVAGDIAENGLESEYALAANYLKKTAFKAFLIAEGNHDIRLRAYSQSSSRFLRFVNYLNEDAAAEYENLGCIYDTDAARFVILGSDKSVFEESYFSAEQLERLDNALKTADGKPVFVINHQPLKDTHGLPGTWGSPVDSAGSVGRQSDELFGIMNKYKNVIFVTGHLHTAFGENLYEKKDNVYLVNVPSVGIKSKDGFYNAAGCGFVVSVKQDEIVFAARDFANGKYVPDGDIRIPLE